MKAKVLKQNILGTLEAACVMYFLLRSVDTKGPEKLFSTFLGEMWCNTDKVQWKTEVRRQTRSDM